MHHSAGQGLAEGLKRVWVIFPIIFYSLAFSNSGFAISPDEDDKPTKTSKNGTPVNGSNDGRANGTNASHGDNGRIGGNDETTTDLGLRIQGDRGEIRIENPFLEGLSAEHQAVIRKLWESKVDENGKVVDRLRNSPEYFRQLFQRQSSAYVDAIAAGIRSSEPSYQAQNDLSAVKQDAQQIVKETVDLIVDLLLEADRVRDEIIRGALVGLADRGIDPSKLSDEQFDRIAEEVEREFLRKVHADEIIVGNKTGRAQLNTVDDSLILDVRHENPKLSLQIVNPKYVERDSSHLRQLINRQIVIKHRDVYPVWLFPDLANPVEVEAQPIPTRGKTYIGKYFNAMVERPTGLADKAVTFAIFGGAQAIASAFIGKMKTGEIDYEVAMVSLIYGGIIAGINSSYRLWFSVADKKSFLEKSLAVSLTFAYIYRAFREGIIDPMILAVPLHSIGSLAIPKYREFLHRGSQLAFTVKYVGITFGLGGAASLLAGQYGADYFEAVFFLGMMGTLGFFENVGLVFNGLVSTYARDIFSKISRIRDILRIKRGPGEDFRIPRTNLSVKRGTAEHQSFYFIQYLLKVSGNMKGWEIPATLFFLTATAIWDRTINLWYKASLGLKTIRNKFGEVVLFGVDEERERLRNTIFNRAFRGVKNVLAQLLGPIFGKPVAWVRSRLPTFPRRDVAIESVVAEELPLPKEALDRLASEFLLERNGEISAFNPASRLRALGAIWGRSNGNGANGNGTNGHEMNGGYRNGVHLRRAVGGGCRVFAF